MILEYLPRQELKQCRLVSKLWGIRCEELLKLKLDTLYLSPRDGDMERFDAMTQDPHFAKKIKHLVIDSAQFVKYSMPAYSEVLFTQLLDDDYSAKHASNHLGFAHLTGLIGAPKQLPFFGRGEFMSRAYGKCQDDPVFLEGFRQYCRLVVQQANSHSPFWFDRARRGLQSIGLLQSLTICNTWEMLYFVQNNYYLDGVIEGATVKRIAERLRDGEIRLERNRALGKSPVARSMPPTVVLPMARAMPWHEPDIHKLPQKPVSDGSLEFAVVVELLKSSGQQPLEIIVPGDSRAESGLPANVFDTTWPTATTFPIICRRLENLDIELAFRKLEPLKGLQSLLKETTSLRKLSLKLPYDPEEDDGADTMHDYSHVFTAEGCYLPTLRNLSLFGMATSYRNLARLLFIDCPALTTLALSYIHLTDGKWEDFIEGLRQSNSLQTCQILGPLTYPHLCWFCYSDNTFHVVNPDAGWESDGHMSFWAAHTRYVNEGGRHPSLAAGKPDGASAEYMVRLNRTLDELRASRV
ncbi:MAG: hypothetical protein LQ346_001762 [Caloplaca aetnensis]|nr:MAG: hypothetical protein LQ346_001762 [Caloplaca aetnensis]